MTPSSQHLLDRFEAGTLDPAGFHHRDHVELAWAHLKRYPLPTALQRLCDGLRRLAQAAGKPERYHETITWAFLVLINERMELSGRDLAWEDFASRNADLLSWTPSVLAAYYPPGILASDLARRVFVLPRAAQAVASKELAV
jgi:hypothetical protein